MASSPSLWLRRLARGSELRQDQSVRSIAGRGAAIFLASCRRESGGDHQQRASAVSPGRRYACRKWTINCSRRAALLGDRSRRRLLPRPQDKRSTAYSTESRLPCQGATVAASSVEAAGRSAPVPTCGFRPEIRPSPRHLESHVEAFIFHRVYLEIPSIHPHTIGGLGRSSDLGTSGNIRNGRVSNDGTNPQTVTRRALGSSRREQFRLS